MADCEDCKSAFVQIQEDFNNYYGRCLCEEVLFWNEALLRIDCEANWLELPCEVLPESRELSNRGIVEKLTGDWSAEDWFEILENGTAAGDTVLLLVLAHCLSADRPRTLSILRQYLKESLLEVDWDASCDPETQAEMLCFAEAAQLMEAGCPTEFASFCLENLPRLSDDNVYATEMILKGIIHLCPDKLGSILQDPTLNFDLRSSLISYICLSDIRSEEIYMTIKMFFKSTTVPEDRLLLGVLLGEYGDPRAIPVLRRYLQALLTDEQTDSAACSEIVGAIRKLGGQSEDLYRDLYSGTL